METISCDVEIEDIKRCYLPGAVIEVPCEKCGEKLVHDFGEQYLSYPVIGGEKIVRFYCEKCDEEYELSITIKSAKIVLEFDGKNIKLT